VKFTTVNIFTIFEWDLNPCSELAKDRSKEITNLILKSIRLKKLIFLPKTNNSSKKYKLKDLHTLFFQIKIFSSVFAFYGIYLIYCNTVQEQHQKRNNNNRINNYRVVFPVHSLK
jgi:hypothetical protein